MATPRFSQRNCQRWLMAFLVAFICPISLKSQLNQQPVPDSTASHSPAAGMQLPPEAQAKLDGFQSALQTAVSANDARGAAKALNQIGEFWFRAGNSQNALQAYNRALAAAKMARDVEQGVTALNGLGTLARTAGQAQEAQQAYQRALEVANAQGFAAGKADALNGLALLSAGQKQPAQALDYANQALAVRRSMGDHAGEAVILAEIATGYNAAGNKQTALEYARQAQSAFAAAGDQRGEASALLGIGDIYASLRDRKAADFYSQALAIATHMNFPRIQAAAANKIGLVESALGESRKALDSYGEALTIYQRMNMADAAGLTLTNIGMAWSALGEKQKALDNLNKALPVLRAAGDRGGEATALNNLGRVYQDLGDRQKAIGYYNQALPILTAVGDRASEDIALNNLGAAYLESGDKQKGIEVLNQALSLQTGESNRRGEAMARVSLGMAYHKLGDDQKALDMLNQGMDLMHQVDDRQNEARGHIALAKVYFDRSDNAKAAEQLNEALPLAQAVNDPLILSPILYGMMMTHKAQPTLAIFYGKQAVNLLQQVRSNMQGLDKELQSIFVSSKAVFYHDLADLLIAQGRLPEAQQVLDLLKQQEYSEYVRGAAADALSPLTLTASEQKAEQDYERSTGQLVAEGQQWADLKSMSTRSPEQEKQFQELSARLDAASKALSDYYARLFVMLGKDNAANKQVADVKGDVSALEDQIAESPHTVALYTMVTSDHYRVIVITATATVAREYAIADSDLNKKVADFEQVLRNPSRDPKPLAQELYTILIGPVKADLEQAKAETLVWSLDGVLRYVPMAALYDGKQYMLEKFNTVTITPASIAHLEEKPDVGNLSVAAMGIARKYEDGLPALPAVAAELNDVVKDTQVQGAHGVLPGTMLLDGAFTEKAFENQLSGKPGVVHIASHFVFKPGDDSQSYLLLSGKDEAGLGST